MADILMLEPDAILAQVYRRTFEMAGHTVRRTVSAQDGVFLVDERMPDLIIVELQLVAHSGIEFLYELRSYAEWQHIPVLVHSCIPPTEFEESRELLRSMLGVQAYLYKPQTTLQSLLRAVRETVEQTAVVPLPSTVSAAPAVGIPTAVLQPADVATGTSLKPAPGLS